MADRKKAKKIDEEKQKASEVPDLEQAAYNEVTDALENNFDFSGGTIVVGPSFVKQLNSFTNEISGRLRVEPKFVGAVSSLVKRLPRIKEAIDQFQIGQGIKNVPAYRAAETIISQEYENQILRSGLNANFIQPLRDLVYQDALSGLTLKEAKSMIRDYIGTGADKSGKLGQYAEQTAMQAVDMYSGIINYNLAKEFNYDSWLVTGSLIDTSAPQCVYVINELGGVLKRSDWPTVKKIAENHGLKDDTTFDNLSILQLHHGCRHAFYAYNSN